MHDFDTATLLLALGWPLHRLLHASQSLHRVLRCGRLGRTAAQHDEQDREDRCHERDEPPGQG